MKKNLRKILGLAGIFVVLVSFLGCDNLTGGKTPTETPTETQTGTIKGRAYYENDEENSSGIIVFCEKTNGLTTESVARAIEVNSRSAETSITTGKTVTADSEGNYEIENLEPGTYSVYAMSDYAKQKISSPRTVTVTAGQTSSNVNLELTVLGSIKGKITLDGEEPGEKAAFIVSIRGTSLGSAYTNADGTFELVDIPAASEAYSIWVSYCGSTLQSFWTDGVTVKGKEATDLGEIDYKMEDIKKGFLKGDTGDKGDKGETGETGAAGKDGSDGKDGTDGDDGLDGTPIIWKGSYESAAKLENPEELWAFYNTTDGCSYIYDGTKWTLLAKAGANGADGEDGSTEDITFLAVDLNYNKYGPNYQNTVKFLDGKTELKAGDNVKLEYKFFVNKKSDLALYFVDCYNTWRDITSPNYLSCSVGTVVSGTLEKTLEEDLSSTDPASLVLCIATDGLPGEVTVTFTEFKILINDEAYTADLSIGTSSEDDTLKHVSAYASDRGVVFYGSIPSDIYGDSQTVAKCSISIVETGSGIEMFRDWSLNSSDYQNWEMTYPLVEAGKTYSFTVKVAYHSYVFYKELVTVTATGGLGEYRVTNADDFTVELTDDRVIQNTGIPEFTDNENVNLEKVGIDYQLYKNDGRKLSVWDGSYLYSYTSYESLENNKLPLKELQYYSGWRDFDYIDHSLSGKCYGICTRTFIQISGYSASGAITFDMNDQHYLLGDWGGEVCKSAVIYGLSYPNDFPYYSSRVTGPCDFSTDNANEEAGIINMPGELKEINGEKYYVQIVDFGDTLTEPVETPEVYYTIDGEDAFEKYYESPVFSGWTTIFPYSADNDNNTVEIDGVSYYANYNYAMFDFVWEYTINYKLSEDTEDIYYSQNISTQSGAAGVDWMGYRNILIPDAPEKDGYKFIQWYTLDTSTTDGVTKTTKNTVKQRDLVIPSVDWTTVAFPPKNLTVTIYAEYSKLYTVTYVDGSETLGTIQACAAAATELPDLKTTETEIFKGWYTDAACTNEWNGTASENMTVYAGWVTVENWYTASDNTNSIYLDTDKIKTLESGDTLWVELYWNTSLTGYYSSSLRFYSNSWTTSEYYSITGGQTKYVKHTFTSNNSYDSNLLSYLKNGNPLKIYDYNSNSYLYIKAVYYEKGPRVNVEFYDGETVLKTVEAVPATTISYTYPVKTGFVCSGLYSDAECTTSWDGVVGTDTTKVYTTWKTAEIWYTGESTDVSFDTDKSKTLEPGDTLWVEVYYGKPSNYTSSSGLYFGRTLESFSMTGGQTKYVKHTFTLNDSDLLSDLKNGSYLEIYFSYSDGNYIKAIYYEKGPRVNVEFYDGETVLQTVEAAPESTVYYTKPAKDGYLPELFTDAAYTKAWNGLAGKENTKIYVKWVPVFTADTAAATDITKYTVVEMSDVTTKDYLYSLKSGCEYEIEWVDSAYNEDLLTGATDCYYSIYDENYNQVFTKIENSILLIPGTDGIYIIRVECEDATLSTNKCAFHIYELAIK